MPIQPTESGPKVEASGFHHQPIKQVPGEHLWICVAMYQVVPTPNGKYFLDTENLKTIEGPGCYWCEQTWKPGMEKTKCPAPASH